MPVISIRDLVKTYHVGEVTVRALRGATLDIEDGEFVAVTGPSGSGKSTFMNILGCLDRPTSGSYVLDGEDVSPHVEGRPRRRPQPEDRLRLPGVQPAVAHDALDNVELPLLYAAPRSSRRRAAPAGASRRSTRSDSGPARHHHPNQLSGGQQQRVAIARALVTRAVDPAGRRADGQPRHPHQRSRSWASSSG